ncbi:MAG TPA: hydroxymethylglutaryl-CoA reductase, degradative [Polyangia bacterium]|nr:hydroxymethylglutaryl-CoA reductase, degradative [Polyangia bacterium]
MSTAPGPFSDRLASQPVAADAAAGSSRLPGFYKLPIDERRVALESAAVLSPDDVRALAGRGLDSRTADHMIENAIGVYGLPLGVGLNFVVNGRDVLVPMAVEEPSVVAAASNAARMVRVGGGFVAEADEPIMTAQIELLGVQDVGAAADRLRRGANALLREANAALPRLVARGGGARELEVRESRRADRLIVHIHVDCRDAMGANIVNTLAETMAGRLAELAGGQHGLRILTNLCDRRCVRVRANVPAAMLATGEMNGLEVARRIEDASRFAEDDPYRAATHNKGIMNGVDPVVIATGNDWRGVEAGAHAFAARSGVYRPLATWRLWGQELCGELEMPLAAGTVGGTLRLHPTARVALRLTRARTAAELGMVIASAGLASNLAALRALASEGIQRGHMTLHNRAASFAGPAHE